MTRVLLLAAAVCLAPAARAGSNDCLFDGDCGSRPSLVAGAPEPVYADAPAAAEAARTLGRWEGAKKGAAEGAEFGMLAVLYPAVALASDGFGRQMSRAYDGARSGNGGGESRFYGGIALSVLLYLPALVIGGLGGFFGGLAGGAAPDAAAKWDAERTLLD